MGPTRDLDPHGDSGGGPEEGIPGRQRPGNDGGNVAVKIVAILGAVVLGLALICAGTITFVWYLTTRTVATVSQNVPKEFKDLVGQNAPNDLKDLVKEAGHVEEVQAAAGGFVNDLRNKNFDRAYQSTSKAYRARTSRKAFEDYVTQRPAICSPNATLLPANLDLGGKRFSFQLTDLEAAQPHDVRLDVVEEDGGWKVDSLESD